MRIAYFTDTYQPEINGVTNTLSKLGAYLDNMRIRQLVIAPDYGGENSVSDSACREVYRFKGITTSLSPKSRLAFPAFWAIDDICDDFKPDIVHVTTELGIGFRGMRYAISRNIPLVMSFHTDYCKYLKYHNLEFARPLLENYLAWFYRFAARTLAPSRNTLEELLSKGYRNLRLWSRGIDTVSFNPGYRNEELRMTAGRGRFVFLYAGRLSAEKNLDMLLYAACEIERRFPGKAAFVFTGDGPYAQIIQNSSLPNAFLTGFKKGKDLSQIYASADCFAFPSGTETFGNAALEAMASGLPVAGVSGGGVTDFLSHNHNSLLCAPDDAAAFTENLISLMKDENLRMRLADNAKKTAVSRDWKNIFDGLVNEYAETIEEFNLRNIRLTA
jgi:glycosyltransferase involved in cell wall biosynthesis